MKVNGSYLLGSYLYKKGHFATWPMLYYVGCYSLHKLNLFSIPKLHSKIFNHLFYGKSYQLFFSLAQECLDKYFDKIVYKPALEHLKLAKKNGHYTAIYSSSPDFLVGLFSHRFNVDEYLGTQYFLDHNGCFSHISKIIEGKEKKRQLLAISDKLNIDIKKTNAYSDSHLDLPFLEAAGNAIAVNPSRKLRKICYKYQWDIL